MGGHGGLNILPQKSWNVYNRSNRQKVQRDEEEAARQAAEAARRDALEQADVKLANMRARATNSTEGAESAGACHALSRVTHASLLPGGHVNLFADVEAAQKNAEHEAEVRKADARAIARIMPDLQLDRSASEPIPWYARVPRASQPSSQPCSSSTDALPAPAVLLAENGGSSKKERRPGDSSERRHKEKKHKRRKNDKQVRNTFLASSVALKGSPVFDFWMAIACISHT